MSSAIERVFIIGAGPFAQELEVYLTKTFDSARVHLVSDFGEDGATPSARYSEIVAMHPDTSVSYLGSGKTFVKARMLSELRGRLGPAVVLNASVWIDEIGDGTLVADGAVIGPRATVGSSVLVNYSASVGHHTHVGDLCVVAPHAAVGGLCRIEERVYIGAGAMIREALTIGRDSTIGMGAIVTRDVPPNSLVTGVNQLRVQPAERRW